MAQLQEERGDVIMTIKEVEGEQRPTSEAQLLQVPGDLRGCHPVIRATRMHGRKSGFIDTCGLNGVAHLKVFAPSFRRSLLVLQALITEANRRGFGVDVGGRCGGLQIVIQGHPFELTMYEESHRVPHQPTKHERERDEHAWVSGYPKYDHLPSGRLSVRSDHGTAGAVLASGGKRWALEDRLGRVFVRLEAEAAEVQARVHERALEEERAREARLRDLEQARERYYVHKQVEWLREQVNRWDQVDRTRKFVTAARANGDLGRDDVRWLDWAESWISATDPLARGLTPGTISEPRPEDLAQFLQRPNSSRFVGQVRAPVPRQTWV